MTHLVHKLNKTTKLWIYKLCRRWRDVLTDFSMRIALNASALSFCIPEGLREPLAQIIIDMAYRIDDLPKKDVWQMSGPGLRIVFVGSKSSSLELLPLFFDKTANHESIGQVWKSGLYRETKKWIDEGCDLVIWQLGRLRRFRSPAPIGFVATRFVSQTMPYPDDGKDLLSGPQRHDVHRRVLRAQREGYEWRFSRSRDDYDFFYERMYLPFVRARHGELAHITPYPGHWDMHIQGAQGGLVLVMQGDKTVAGSVCFVTNRVCFGVEMGIIDGDAHLFQQGINAYLFWAVAQWGKQQGAEFYDLGASNAWRSNKIFHWKAKLGANVTRNIRTNQILAFSANRLPPSLRDRINEIGFVCENDNRYYGLMINAGDAALTGDDIDEATVLAKKDGLSGICVAAPGAPMQRYE